MRGHARRTRGAWCRWPPRAHTQIRDEPKCPDTEITRAEASHPHAYNTWRGGRRDRTTRRNPQREPKTRSCATYTAAPASECGGRQGRATPTPQCHLPMNEARHAPRANWTTLERFLSCYDFTTAVVISFPRRRPSNLVLARRCRRAGVPVDATHARARCVHILYAAARVPAPRAFYGALIVRRAGIAHLLRTPPARYAQYLRASLPT